MLRNKGLRRSIGSEQLKLRMLVFGIQGTPVTPIADGFDRLGIASIVDNGLGDYTIIFANPFVRDCIPLGFMARTAGTHIDVTAVAADRITVQCTDLAGGAQDADFNISVMGSDGRFDY